MWAKIKRWFYKLIGRKSKEDEVFGLEVFDEMGDKTVSLDSEMLLSAGEFNFTVTLGGSRIIKDFSHIGRSLLILHTDARWDATIDIRVSGASVIIDNKSQNTTPVAVSGVIIL